MRRVTARQMAAVFLTAALIRGILFVHTIDHPRTIFQPDSRMYVSLAEGLKQHRSFAYPDAPNRPNVERVPGYPIFLAATTVLFGNYLSVILLQVFLDSVCCVLVFLVGEKLWSGSGLLAGLLAAVNLGMITYSHFLLNDSLFLLLFVILLLAMLRLFSHPSWRWSLLTGVGMAAAGYIRPVVIYIPFFFVLFFFTYCLFTQRDPLVPALGKSILIVLVFVICLSPWMARNNSHYGRFKFTAQGGEHLLQYVLPFTWQYSKGIPFIDGMKEANLQFSEKMNSANVDVAGLNPFEKSELQVETAMNALRAEPVTAIVKAWLFGMIKNLFAPGIIDLSYLLGVERPHFFYTEGTTTLERGWNFIAGMKGWFSWAVIANIVILLLARIMQVWGLIQIMRSKLGIAMFLILIIGYFLAVSGPVGYAKYRLPFEPILIVLLAIGLRDLWERWKGRRLRLEV